MEKSSTKIPFVCAAIIAVSIYSATSGPNFYGPDTVVSKQKTTEGLTVDGLKDISAGLATAAVKTVKMQP